MVSTNKRHPQPHDSSDSELRISFSRRHYGLFGPSAGGGESPGMELLASGSLLGCIKSAIKRRDRDEWLLIMVETDSGWKELSRHDRFRLREIAQRRGHMIRYAVNEPLPPAFLDPASRLPVPA